VQQRGVDGLEAGKSVIVPGVSNRVGAAANRLIPASCCCDGRPQPRRTEAPL